MAKQYRNPEKTKRALLRAAGELLSEKGLYGFHVHDIAEKAGYGKPLVYRYFGDRIQVLDALALAKVDEGRKSLEKLEAGRGDLPAHTYRQLLFARLVAADPVLRGLYRAQLSGQLGNAASQALNDLLPCSGAEGDAGAAEAFLLSGISYVLLLRDSLDECAGIPIKTATDLAAFERAFVALSSKN